MNIWNDRYWKLFLGLLILTNSGFSQSKTEASLGFGWPELINTRIRYGQDIQVGVCVGFIAFEFFDELVVDWSCSAEVLHHFAGKSKYTEQEPWYLLGGLGYYHFPMFENYDQYDIGFYPRLGRTINFSPGAGLNLDVGILLPMSRSPDNETFDFMILPTGSISLTFRLSKL
jgi:hypothetical protein